MSKRSSNFECLRLIAMFMIVLIHANMYLPFYTDGAVYKIQNGIINGICNTGVTLFILISGYFGLKFDIRKIVKMECMMITFSILETVILYFFSPEPLQRAALLEQAAKSLLPFITRKYWFYSCYVCLVIFSGFIDKLIEQLSRRQFGLLIIGMLIVFSVFPTFFYFEITQDNGKGLVQMLMIYLIGRYIRIHISDEFALNGKKVFILSMIIVICWAVNGLSHEFPISLGDMVHHLCKDNSITNIAIAVSVFLLFMRMNMKSGLVNFAAKYVFAVFALNNTLVTLIFGRYSHSLSHVWQGPLLALGLLVGCLIIGMVRDLLLRKPDELIANAVIRIVDSIHRDQSQQ